MRRLRFLLFAIVVLVMSSCGASKKALVRQEKINTVVNTAKSYIGTPYRWGGTTRAGMDWSGLLINSYSSIKYALPRTSVDQSKIGKKVGMGKLETGDLVFFATGKKRRRITHVGLVTSVRGGEVKFIHSSSSLGVVESSLSSSYYKKRFITGRRPF